jgi:endoglucanase
VLFSTTLTPIADAYVRNGSYASTNFGTAADLQAKYSSTANDGYSRDTFLKFDLSSISSVSSATLQLYGVVNDSSTLSLAAYPVSTTSWVESGSGSIDWSNMPSAGTAITTTNVSGTSAAWFSWDLSSYIEAEKTAGVNTVSIEIAGTTNTSGNADFNSREASANQPQLVITSAAAPTVATAASASPWPASASAATSASAHGPHGPSTWPDTTRWTSPWTRTPMPA